MRSLWRWFRPRAADENDTIDNRTRNQRQSSRDNAGGRRSSSSSSTRFTTSTSSSWQADGGDGTAGATQFAGRILHFIDRLEQVENQVPSNAAEMISVFENGLSELMAMHTTGGRGGRSGLHGTPEQQAARREIIRMMQMVLGPSEGESEEDFRRRRSAATRRHQQRASSSSERPRADAKCVSSLPMVEYWDEKGLRTWSVRDLKREVNAKCAKHKCVQCVEKGDLIATLLASQSHNEEASSVQTECAVCLGEFVHGERLRCLPCGHRFHHQCVDPWLLNHSAACPLCQKSVQT